MEKKISVIIPVYNTKEELPRCLDSIIHQTYPHLEIICIDDGSSDGSEHIVDKYATLDDRIIAVHQSNHGESNARNTGLKIATGDYVAFCDCDDWIDLDMYETMVRVAEEKEVDIVATSWYKETNDATIIIKNELPVLEGAFGRDVFLRYIYMRDSFRAFAYMWNKLYKRSVLYNIQNEPLLFNESIRLGGDVIYLAEAALNAKNVIYVDSSFYHYNQREKSGCHTTDLEKLREWIKAYEIVIKRFEQENIEKLVLDYVKRFMAYHSCNFAKEAIRQKNSKYIKIFCSFMNKCKEEYINLNKQYPERITEYLLILENNDGENNYEVEEQRA